MKVSQRFKVLSALALAIVLLLAGCAAPPTTPTPAPTSAPTPTTPAPTPTTAPAPKPPPTPTGPYGELRIALASFGGEGFYPVTEMITTRLALLEPMFDDMVRLEGVKQLPRVVEKWEFAADGLSWTLHIRKGIKFHNGDDLTAKDVAFSIEANAAPDAMYTQMKQILQRTEMVDDYTVRVYTKGTQPDFLNYASFYTPCYGQVLPKDYIGRYGIDYFKQHPIGSGPWKFVRHVAGDMVEYEAWEKHWRQVPEFKKLTVILMPEETTRVASIKTGEVDSIDVGIDAASELERAGFKTANLGFFTPAIYLKGTYDPRGAKFPTADIRVRQALSLAINRDEVNSVLFHGKGQPSASPFFSTFSQNVDINYWLDYAAKINRYSPDDAKKLLKEAGYPDGFSIKLYTMTVRGAPYLPDLAQVIQGYWGKVGVKAEIVTIDSGTYSTLRRLTTTDLIGQAVTFRKENSPFSVADLVTGYYSTGSERHFFGGATQSGIDKTLDAASNEMDSAARTKMLAEVIKAAVDSSTALPIKMVPAMLALTPQVEIDFPSPANGIPIYADIAKHKK